MDPINIIDSYATPISIANCDTDQIIPSRYLQEPYNDALAKYLFADYRDSQKNSGFILDDKKYMHNMILVSGDNFGCGSSREHAVWALYKYGFRAIIAPSFGDIFEGNCLKNGLLPVVLPMGVVNSIIDASLGNARYHIIIDLPAQTVTLDGQATYGFDVDLFSKTCMMQGIDDISYTLSRKYSIDEYERHHARQ